MSCPLLFFFLCWFLLGLDGGGRGSTGEGQDLDDDHQQQSHDGRHSSHGGDAEIWPLTRLLDLTHTLHVPYNLPSQSEQVWTEHSANDLRVKHFRLG